jgi:hypothetical protein
MYMVLNTDICRYTREGWIEDNINLWIKNETLYFKCQELMGFAAGFHLIPDKSLNAKVKNMTYPEYFDREGFFDIQFKVPYYEVDYALKPAKVSKWDYLYVPRIPMIYQAQIRALELSTRNYSNLNNDIPILGGYTLEHRLKDFKEEYIRDLLAGDLSMQYYEWGLKFSHYIYDINSQNIW